MIWLVFTLDNEYVVNAINKAIYYSLLHDELIEPNNEQVYTFKKYHPSKDLVAACFKLGKNPEWDSHILKYINQADLVNITSDWDTIT
jgi:hypothetical protein